MTTKAVTQGSDFTVGSVLNVNGIAYVVSSIAGNTLTIVPARLPAPTDPATLNSINQTTVGAAGGASSLPATPTGYLTVVIGGAEMVIPYYAQA